MSKAWLSVAVFALQSVFSYPQERARAELPYEGERIVIVADRLEKQPPDRWIAEGEVEVTYQEVQMNASRVVYDSETGDALLEGPVELRRGMQWLKGSRAELNLHTDTGVVHDAEGFTDAELFINTPRLLKTGPGTYRAEKGFFTACDEAVPKWSFTVSSAQIQVESTARLTHTFFRVKNVPILYLPLVIFPTETKTRSSGFMLPTTGSSTNKGRRISQSFYLVLGPSADVMLRSDYFSLRGFGHGATFRARPTAATSLMVDGYGVKDRRDQGGASLNVVGETHFGSFGNSFRAVADFNLVTDFIFRQVFADDFFLATRPNERSLFFVTTSWGTRSVNLLLAREETAFPTRNAVTRTLPGINFKISGQKLPSLPFYLDLSTSLEALDRIDRFIESPRLTQRFDVFPELYTAVPLVQGLRLTPRLGLRQTYYSHSLRPVPESPGGIELSGDRVHRQYLDLSLQLAGWGLSRNYREGSEGSWKHLIEPQIQYRYLSGIDNFPRIIRFDERDAIANTHEVEYALFNRLFLRRQREGRDFTSEWFSLKVAQKFYFDPDFGGAFQEEALNQFFPLNTLTGFLYGATRRSFSPVTALVRMTPEPRYSLDVRTDYDPKFGRFRNFSVTGFLNRPGLSLATSYFLTRRLDPASFDGHQIQGHLTLGDFNRGPSLTATFSHDAETGRLLNYLARANYFWDCCGVSLEIMGFNVRVREERQIRFSFFLKGIGSFGTIKRPHALF